MHSDSTLLAVIPARGGSKGLPGKNVLDCAGKPLIAWTIAAAKAVVAIDDVIVSTDSPEIAEVARWAGAAVPFLRPPELATDDAGLVQVLQHVWERHHAQNGRPFDYIVLLQPTSPLRAAGHIAGAIDHYFGQRRGEDDTLASVCKAGTKHGWLMTEADDNRYISFCFDVNTANPQRQNLRNYYLPNGAIFIARGATLGQGLYRANTMPYVMQTGDSVDIDTLEDLRAAELLLRSRAAGA
jgi:CMP-N-acetylneuraminic acid synthetase